MVEQDLLNSVNYQLHRAAQLSDEFFVAEAAKQKITPRQSVVLAAVFRHSGLSQTEIVDLTGMDRSTLADVVRRLIQNGLLTKKRKEDDGRAFAVSITERGEEILRHSFAWTEKSDDALLSKLPTADRRKFVALLGKLLAD